MTGIVLRIAGLTAIYLLVLTSLKPGDILVGAALASALVLGGRVARTGTPADGGWIGWSRDVVGMIALTARDMVTGSIRVARFCLGGPAAPGFVEVPREGRSEDAVALWGLLTGEAPDEYPVAIDPGRDVLIVHVLDAHDPDAVRERHRKMHERWQRHVVR
jgi:multisubunit Na+/H+ antiporter MnhE subunit